MKKKIKKLYLQAKKRYLKKVIGTVEKPRLAVFRSHKLLIYHLPISHPEHKSRKQNKLLLTKKMLLEFSFLNIIGYWI